MSVFEPIPSILTLNVGLARHNADWNYNDVNSPFTRIYYVTKGSGILVTPNGRFNLREGKMYIVPAFMTHSDICHGVFEHYYAHIYEDVSTGQSTLDSLEFPTEIDGTDYDLYLFRLVCEHNELMRLKYSNPKLYDNNKSLIESIRFNSERLLYDRMETQGIIFQLLSRFIRYAKPKYYSTDQRIRQAIHHINTNISESFVLGELAEHACMSVDHFIRKFRKEIGCTPAQYIIQRKITKAQILLASTDLPIKDVASSIGCYDFSYFSRLFKKHTSLTPLKYRNSFNPE